jgi:predicted nucleotide-binding protein (sugar kinase/HSP70/actin superfamily)
VRADAQTFVTCLRAVIAADLIKAVAHRIRPYEHAAGATDRALADARDILARALREDRSVWLALRRARQRFDAIDVDLTQAKPKVKITGEFWAQTTEGDASYHLPSWLEAEGAEVVTEPIAAWFDYLFWCAITNARDRSGLERDVSKKLLGLYAAAALFRGVHTFYRAAMGFGTAPLPSQRMLHRYARDYYNPRIVGGEGHLEVAHRIHAAVDRQAHMIVSIKPFGCLPSTQSDGVQSRVAADFADSLFIPIETSGDGEVNVRSRLQMTLFEAKARARDEAHGTLRRHGLTIEAVREYARCHAHLMRPLQRLPHHYAGTAANFIAKVARVVR